MPFCTMCGKEVDVLDSQKRCSECSTLEEPVNQYLKEPPKLDLEGFKEHPVRKKRWLSIIKVVAVVLVVIMIALVGYTKYKDHSLKQKADREDAEEQREEHQRTMIKSELGRYAAEIIRWYKTPRNQGGAGYSLEGMNKTNLVNVLGLDSNYSAYFSDGDFKVKLIGITGPDEILMIGAPKSHLEGYPDIFLDISIPSCEYNIY